MDSASRPARSDESATKVRAVLLLGAIPNQHNFVRMGVPRLREEFDLHILDLNQLLGREKASQGNAASFDLTPIADAAPSALNNLKRAGNTDDISRA